MCAFLNRHDDRMAFDLTCRRFRWPSMLIELIYLRLLLVFCRISSVLDRVLVDAWEARFTGECLNLPPSVKWCLVLCLNWCFVTPWTVGPDQPTTCALLSGLPGLLAGRVAQAGSACLSLSHITTGHPRCGLTRGLNFKGEGMNGGARKWAVQVIRLTPYHRRCDSTQRHIVADVIPPPAPRQRR